jgi:hypothetical protein
VESWCDGDVRDVRRADQHAVEYITKQRRCLPPDYEKRIRRKRTKGATIPGVRRSITAAARQLLGEARPANSDVSTKPTEEAGAGSEGLPAREVAWTKRDAP